MTLITDREIKLQQAPERPKTIWETDPKGVKGFGVRILPSGVKSFFINYRIDGVEKRFTIGRYPTWSVEAARTEAKGLRRRIDRGEDPADERRGRRDAPTVEDLAERYRVEHLPRKAKSSQVNDLAMIVKEILPRIGNRQVAGVHLGDMQTLHDAVTKAKGPVRANRVIAVASMMFALALRPMVGEDVPWRDQAQGNPCRGLRRNSEQGRERFFSPAELAALSDAFGESTACDCLRLIMLTGCRPGEAMRSTWAQFDDEPGFWIKPSSEVKQRRTHRTPLAPGALQLIERIRARRDAHRGEFVFPGRRPSEPLTQIKGPWRVAAEKASIALWRESQDQKVAALIAELERGLSRLPTVGEVVALAQKTGVRLPQAPYDARTYDLRHSFASVGAGGGLSLHIIGKLLGHSQAKTTMRYAHLGDDPLREAVTKIATEIADAGKDGAKVVTLDGARRR